MSDRRHVPLPEAIDGEEWAIEETPYTRFAGVDKESRRMVVPLGGEKQARAIRNHEMIHTKISPSDRLFASGIHPGVLQLCEDARVHGHMERLGFRTRDMEGIIDEAELKSMATEAHPAVLAATAAAMCGTGEDDRLYPLLPDERTAVYQFGKYLAYRRMSADVTVELPDFDEVEQMAREIIEMFGDPSQPPPPQNQQHGPQSLADMLPDDRLLEMTQKRPNPAEVHGSFWGEMEIEEPPLPLTLPGKMRKKRKKLPDVRGRRLHRVGRLYADGRVFKQTMTKTGGGAVLIDTSGSMSLEPEEVLQLCVAYPAGVIAAYSGISSDHGTLRVIARNGRRVTDEMIDPPGGGNTVDGPALDWLAKQPGPRWWISDAGVQGGQAGLLYCYEVCKRANIKRVDDAWQIVGKPE